MLASVVSRISDKWESPQLMLYETYLSYLSLYFTFQITN
jgi:hypothetical protein